MKTTTEVEVGANTDTTDVTPLSVRPPTDLWSLVPVLLIFGMGVLAALRMPPNNHTTQAVASWPAALALSSVFFIPAVLLVAYLCRARVTATETGLKSSGLFTDVQTPWGDIGDFYTLPLPGRHAKEKSPLCRDAHVLNRSGEVAAAFSTQAKHAGDLQAVIIQRATNAKTRAWHVKGARSCDPQPRVFTYDTGVNRANRSAFPALCFLVVALFGGLSVYLVVYSLARHDFGWWTLGEAAIVLVLGSVYVGALGSAAKRQKVAIRLDERYIVDADGFTFCALGRIERVLWKNVTGYGYAPQEDKGRTSSQASISPIPPYRIETRQQGAFDFSHFIGEGGVLREIVRLNATHAKQTDWPAPPPDTFRKIT